MECLKTPPTKTYLVVFSVDPISMAKKFDYNFFVIKIFWPLKLGPLKIQPNMFLWVVFLNIPFRDGVLCLSRLQNSHMPKHFTYSFAYLYLAMGSHSSQINILLCWPFWPSTFHFLKANGHSCSFRPFEPLGLNMMGEGTHTLWELKCSRSWCIYLKKSNLKKPKTCILEPY